MDLPSNAVNTILSCTKATGVSSAVMQCIVVHLNRSGWYVFQATQFTVWGWILFFLQHVSFVFF